MSADSHRAFIELIGLETTARSEGAARNELTVGPEHLNPHGTVHGAVMYAMADTGMGAALYTRLEDSETCATIEVKMVYLAAVTSGRLVCHTSLVHRSRRVATLECEVRNESGADSDRLVAKALGTFAIMERPG